MKKIIPIIIIAALALCGCEKKHYYGATFVMSVEITKVPVAGEAYSLEIYKAGDHRYNHVFSAQTEFPHTFKVSGGIYLKDTERQVAAIINAAGDTIARDTLMELSTLNYLKDENMHFTNNGVYGIWHLVY